MSRTRIPEDAQLSVVELSDDGYGLSHFQASEQSKLRDIFIKGALPGERVTARVHKRRRGQFWAEVTEVLDPADSRAAAPCSHFPRCGGCVLQHLNYAQQLQHKQQLLLSQLARVEVAYQSLAAPVSGPRLHYRSKARLGVRKLGDELLVGFREGFGSRVLRMDQCFTLSPALAALVQPVREVLNTLSIAHAIPQLELAVGDGAPQVVVRHLESLVEEDVDQLKLLQQQTGATVLLQSGGPESLVALDGSPPTLLSYGLPPYGLDMAFGALDFTQVNLALNQQLINQVVAALAPLPGARIIDLFCGIGNFSLPLAQRGARVLGIEGSVSSVARATANAERNGLSHRSDFEAMDLYSDQSQDLFADPQLSIPASAQQSQIPSSWFAQGRGATALLLDPPRSGAGPALASWLAAPALAEVNSIAYVSCNPASFADDAKVLVAAGYTLERVGVFDMFPQTAHVETLGVFRRG